jgi:hypothetical protein
MKICIERLAEMIVSLSTTKCQYQDNIFMRKLLYHYTEFSLYCEIPVEKTINVDYFTDLSKSTVTLLQ